MARDILRLHDDILVLGGVLLRFIQDEETLVWVDNKDGFARLVLDGNVWDLSEKEQEVIKRLQSK